MFNSDLKERAIRLVKKAAREYELEFENIKDKSTDLFDVRTMSREEVIIPVENFINTLANSPKEFKKSIGNLEIEYDKFENEIRDLEREAQDVDFKAGGTAAAGVVTGVGAAALLPTGAMAIATTFGVASTGTAISALSGAAATNAALAWLGGGALVAGGTGMAGGSALLALAGPIGWGIAGAGIVGGGLLASSKNKKVAEEANDQRYDIEQGTKKFKRAIVEVNGIINSTNSHSKGIKDLLNILAKYTPKNYEEYDQREKEMLGSLINHIQGLSKLINKKVIA